MTNKEAIYELKMMKRMVNADSLADEANEFFLMIMKQTFIGMNNRNIWNTNIQQKWVFGILKTEKK